MSQYWQMGWPAMSLLLLESVPVAVAVYTVRWSKIPFIATLLLSFAAVVWAHSTSDREAIGQWATLGHWMVCICITVAGFGTLMVAAFLVGLTRIARGKYRA